MLEEGWNLKRVDLGTLLASLGPPVFVGYDIVQIDVELEGHCVVAITLPFQERGKKCVKEGNE